MQSRLSLSVTWDTICREYAKSPVMDEFVNWLRNDMHDVEGRDDVLTVLIHLGYLSYDRETRQCYLPNREVADEMESAIKKNNWKPVIDAVQEYTGDILLVGISYDQDTKEHKCHIERYIKDTPPDSFTPFNQKNLVVRRE